MKLRKAGRFLVPGSEYADADALLNEAMTRAYNGAADMPGLKRHWPRGVPFEAFLIKTMQGLASDSRRGAHIKKRVMDDEVVRDGTSGEEIYPESESVCPDLLTEAIAREDSEIHQQKCAVRVATIEKLFEDDQEILLIIECLKDGKDPAEICDICNLTATQYASARRRMRRRFEKHGAP